MKELSPDAAISFLPRVNISSVIAKIGTKVPLIVSERVDPKYLNVSSLDKLFIRLVYPFADAIVLQTDYVKKYYKKL